jgi:hypothetical protein
VRFHGHIDSATLHVFHQIYSRSCDVVLEDILMKMFVCTLENEALD